MITETGKHLKTKQIPIFEKKRIEINSHENWIIIYILATKTHNNNEM